MRKKLALFLVVMMAVSFLLPSVWSLNCAGPKSLQIDLVNSTPNSDPVILGTDIRTEIHISYPDGRPVSLDPPLVSIIWSGSEGWIEFDNIPLTTRDIVGFYSFTETVTADLVNVTGPGKATLSVVACSCQDARGNRGPTQLTSSDQTLSPSDNSHVIMPQIPRISTVTVTQESESSASSAVMVIPSNFLNMAFLMLAAITISIALIAAILVIRILLRRKHREEGLYGDQ